MFTITSTTLLLLSAASAFGAVQLNAVDPEAVQAATLNTKACRSAHLQSDADACAPIATCAAQYLISTIDDSKTEAPISLEPGRVVGTNSIEIVVQHAAVRDRIVNRIVLNENNAACNYPGANWRKGVQSSWAIDSANNAPVCRDTYVSGIPWTTDCGLVRGENATHVWFRGAGTVFYQDSLGTLDGVALGQRDVSSVVRFEIVQPRVIRDISTQVRILDEPRLLAAVTRQLFDLTTGNATLTLALSLASPLRTASLLSIGAPTGVGAEQKGAVDNALCADDATSACQQRYTFALDPRELCQLDGAYTFSFAVQCHPSIAGTPACPTSSTTAPLQVTATLDTEDFCAVVQGLLAVNGSMTSHGEFAAPTFAFGPLKTAFFQDQPIHFQVKAESLNQFPFASSDIILVEVEDKSGERKTLYDVAAGGAREGWTFSFAEHPDNQLRTKVVHRHQFSFVAAPSVFGDVERNVPIDSDVVVAVEVAFVNPVGPNGKKKRAVVEHRLAARQLMTNVRSAEAQLQIKLEAAQGIAAAATTAAARPEQKGTTTNPDELIESSATALSFSAVVLATTVISAMMM
jgi:hypothetical protein